VAQSLAGVPVSEVPIKHITNGIHIRSWLSPELSFTLDRYLGERMDEQSRRIKRSGRVDSDSG
jgi:starch phosphorylase